MFSCCLPSCGGSGFRKAKKKSLFSHYRHWLGPHLHRLCPLGRRSTQSCTQEVVEELTDGFGYSISLDRDQLHRATINNQGCSESEDESTLSVTEACRMRALQAGMMQRLSESVLPAFPSRVLCSVITSLCRDSGSSTAHQVLDQLFPRSHLPSVPGDALIPFGTHGGSLAHCVRDAGGQDHLPNAIYFLLGTWLGQGQDCREPLRFSLGPCSWPLCTSALVAPTWRAMPTFCQATWSISRPLRPNGKELFKTLVPAHCLGSIWSERDNRERESLAPTVRDTVMHDNTVANCILVTCLGDASMTAQDRARVVELWIRVAEVSLGTPCLDAWELPLVSQLSGLKSGVLVPGLSLDPHARATLTLT
uniref:Ras-GEF domain-containing protein n=1 Tax=Equus caballus TaxID=9796 RepID=A0A9L0SRR8_HORSE